MAHIAGPRGMRVEVGVRVDEARCDDAAGGVDVVLRRAEIGTDRAHHTSVDGHIGAARRAARAIDNHPAGNHGLMHVASLAALAITIS